MRSLALRVPHTEVVPVRHAEQVAAAIEPVGAPSVVAVVRDPGRHPCRHALAAAADVVVDVGWPATLPEGVPAVRTRGIATPLLAAANVLASRRLELSVTCAGPLAVHYRWPSVRR